MQNQPTNSSSLANNQRIAKNTLLLYVRMLFIMGVSLYTSREVLSALGVDDFGTYGVVGSIITMFTFINAAMVTSTQRFLTFEIGRNNIVRLKQVFSTSLQIHALISLLIVLLGETIGLWILFNKMVIPETRMTAAFWVYQCSILACVATIMSTPYKANIVSREEMAAFAYISVVEVTLKLAIVYLLSISPFDKLIVYAVLILLVQISINLIYVVYCKRHYEEATYSHHIERPLFKEMSHFAGWSFWGNLASILNTQGINLLLNVSFGLVCNSAREFAVQVQTAVQQFVGNFQMALNPQITKNYATGNMQEMHTLMFRSARFSFFLLYFLALPIILETNFVLTTWLKNVPDYTVIFTQIILCTSLINTTASPCVIANQATGKVKVYQAVVGGILLITLPLAYIALQLGAPAYGVFIVQLCIDIIAQLARMLMLRNQISLPLRAYLRNIYLPIFLVVVSSLVLPILVHQQLDEGWLRFIAVGTTCVISVSSMSFMIGLTAGERKFIIRKFNENVVHRIFK